MTRLELSAQLRSVPRNGVTVKGTQVIAVPVLDVAGMAVAAISVLRTVTASTYIADRRSSSTGACTVRGVRDPFCLFYQVGPRCWRGRPRR